MKCLFFLGSILWGLSASAAVVVDSGNFLTDEVDRLKDLAFLSNSNDYVSPNAGNLTAFRTLANTLYSGNVAGAGVLAAPLGYEVVVFSDTLSGETFHGLREVLVGGQQQRGWGSFYLNLNNSKALSSLIEVPHPLFDTNTPEVASRSFLESTSLGFLMAGAHRNANGAGTADVAHLANSIFTTVHEEWNSQNTVWQIHGFNLDNQNNFPLGTDVVLSNGDGSLSSEIVFLDASLEAESFSTFDYNTLDPNSSLNLTVNGGVNGTTFIGLAGQSNVQGVYTRGEGGLFIHIELEQSIRFNAGNRILTGTAIAEAIQLSATQTPEPSTLLQALLGTLLLVGSNRQNMSRREIK